MPLSGAVAPALPSPCGGGEPRLSGYEHLPPVSVPFRRFLSRLTCWASAQRRSLGAKIARKLPAHRCFTVSAEQIWDEARRRPQGILSYFQGLQRRFSSNLPAETGRGSNPLSQGIRGKAACLPAAGRRSPIWGAASAVIFSPGSRGSRDGGRGAAAVFRRDRAAAGAGVGAMAAGVAVAEAAGVAETAAAGAPCQGAPYPAASDRAAAPTIPCRAVAAGAEAAEKAARSRPRGARRAQSSPGGAPNRVPFQSHPLQDILCFFLQSGASCAIIDKTTICWGTQQCRDFL